MLANLVGRTGQLDAAGLTSPSGMYLGLYHPEFAAQCFGSGDGLIGRRCGTALRHIDAVLGEQSLRLILVQIHKLVFVVAVIGRVQSGERTACGGENARILEQRPCGRKGCDSSLISRPGRP